jgi:hypothetical protein
LILEDDVLRRVSPNRTNLPLLQDLVARPYAVVIVGGTFMNHDEEHRASHSYAASSDLMNGDYIFTFLSTKEGLMNRNMNPKNIDVWWNRHCGSLVYCDSCSDSNVITCCLMVNMVVLKE